MNKPGVHRATKKNGSLYYRSSITYKGKHISLGSFSSEDKAHQAYIDAKTLISTPSISLTDYSLCKVLPHDKFICIMNYRDNGIYISNPLYIRKQYFEYYLSKSQVLKFDRDDLFFYASHKIQQRGGYLFVSDYGSQYKILSRFGIKPFAVYGRDYIMMNGDPNDYRYSNIKIINSYIGVRIETKNGISSYPAYIHVNGDYLIGRYNTEIEAAIAYNKAADTLNSLGFEKAYIRNYITSIKSLEYRELYNNITISRKLYHIDFDNITKNDMRM